MIEDITQPIELKLEEVFNDNQYIIPIYQRSYAWEKDEIEQLLTDINDSEGRYYLGSLIVDKITGIGNVYSVIDGQQRLTTIYLLLSYLKPELIKYNSLSFQARDKSNITLKAIREEGTKLLDSSYNIEESYYSQEILKGYRIISDYFNSPEIINRENTVKDNPATFDSFKKKFIDKLSNIIIIRTQVPKKIDLNHYFEIMNTRGEQLELHEIVKGRILKQLNKEDQEMAATIWDGCSQMNSYVQMTFDTYVRPMIFGDMWDKFKPNNFDDLRKCFIDANNKRKQKEKENNTLDPKSNIKFSLFSKLDNYTPSTTEPEVEKPKEEKDRFESIITFPFLLLIINEAIATKYEEDDSQLDDKKFLEKLGPHCKDKTSAETFLYNLLRYRYLFDFYIIKRENIADKSSWSLQRLEKYHYDKKNTDKPDYKNTYPTSDAYFNNLVLLQSALRITYTSPKTMHWIARLLSTMNNIKNIKSKDLLNTLEYYACEKVYEADYRNASGFGVARIIFSYLDYILIRDKVVSMPNFQFTFRSSIEHFSPQHPNNPNIKKWDDENLNNFGNLALITVSANSKFSNLPPASKIISYPDTIKQSPKLKKMSELQNKNKKWDENIARAHGEAMLSLLDNELSRVNIL